MCLLACLQAIGSGICLQDRANSDLKAEYILWLSIYQADISAPAFQCTTLGNFCVYLNVAVTSSLRILGGLHELRSLIAHLFLDMAGCYFITVTCHYRGDFFLTMICEINTVLYVLNSKVTSISFIWYIFSNLTFQINFAIESYIICFWKRPTCRWKSHFSSHLENKENWVLSKYQRLTVFPEQQLPRSCLQPWLSLKLSRTYSSVSTFY